jgi:flagella basal body P-ring formation protein FlgA
MNRNRTIARRRSYIATLLTVTAFCSAAVAGEPPMQGQIVTSKTVEHYVPEARARIASIELRGEASITGGDVTLKQVCRWPDADAAAFAEVADLIVLHLADKAFDTITIDQIQATLRDSGMNPALVNFAGAGTCTVSRSDVKADEGSALRNWVGTAAKRDEPTADDQMQADLVAAAARKQANAAGKGDADPALAAAAAHTGDLRAQLIRDVATRLSLPVESLQVDFKPEDRKMLSLAAPFEFGIEPQRYGDLGDTSWLISISSGEKVQRLRITAVARAWTEQLVLSKPVNLRQTIAESDFEVKRTLADKLSRDPLVSKDSAIGQQAARDLKVGTILTSRLLSPVELVRSGQLVTVLMRRGTVEVKSVAVALQNGSAGQSIKVKNDVTNQVFQVTLTGPQTGMMTSSDPLASAE